MKYRFEFIIMVSAFLCLLMASVALGGSCTKTLYVDGVLIDSSVGPQGLTWPYDRITIGAENDRWYLYNEYIGNIDDFAIYDGVMSSTRVAAHYAARTNYATYETEVSSDNPLMWLKFDDPCTAHDYWAVNSGSISAIDGQYVHTGGGAITQVTGFHADSNAINIPDTVADAPGHCVDIWDGNGDFGEATDGNVTVEIWVNFTDINSMADNDYPRFYQHNGDWNITGGYGVLANDPNELTVVGGASSDVAALSFDINDGTWHHVVVTYESVYDIPDTNNYPNEITADSPALYLRLNDLTDSSDNNYWVDAGDNVTLQQVKGSMGSCAYLNGDWIAAANTTYEPCLPTDYSHAYGFGPNDLTVEFWIYYPEGAVDAYASFFNQCDDEDPNYYSPYADRADTKCRIGFGDNREGGGGQAYTAEGAWSEDANNWHHIVVIWDTEQDVNGNPLSTTVKWFTDNVSYKDSTYAYPAVSDGVIGPEMDHILFGNRGSRDEPGVNQYRHYIDEIAVYPYVLSEERIEAHYYAWEPKDCEEIWDRQMADQWEGIDKNKDCDIDFVDYALFAQEWTLCNDPTRGTPECPPNW